MNEKGQIILILILVMTVALAIGLSVVQKSLVDVSTSTKVEQSSRAFSAAEAGIEKALQSDSAISTSIPLDNQSVIQGVEKNAIPPEPATGVRQIPLEYPPLPKEDVAQVWLANLYSTDNPPSAFYTQNSLDVYWGAVGITDENEKPAIEIKIIKYSGGSYIAQPFYLDSNITRASGNNFTPVPSGTGDTGCSDSRSPITTTSTEIGETNDRKFYCKFRLSGLSSALMLLRARILYSSASQPFAVQAVGIRGAGACASGGCWLPTQARIFRSTGTAGETQRKVEVFRLDKVVPPYFDYAIFSAGKIEK